jgi:hypothetical protein
LTTHTTGAFYFDYEEDRMKSAFLNGNDIKSTLLELIKTDNKSEMDDISDKIFATIESLDNQDNLYELSIALSNFYFETFWEVSLDHLSEGKTKAAEKIMLWSCENAWKQEAIKNYTYHKGTPYFFLGLCYMINGNLDLLFQMIHNGHVEGLIVYQRLGKDYKTAPSYLFMTLNANNPNNAAYEYVLNMKQVVEKFIKNHNRSASTSITYEIFDKKFLERTGSNFEQIKFVLVYFLMNLINLNKHDKKSLTSNSFSNLRRIDLMRGISLVIDKTLAEKYKTNFISHGIIKYFVNELGITEDDSTKLQNVLTYSDGRQFLIKGNAEDIVSELLSNGVRYKNKSLDYRMKCMLLVWKMRNFSAHNLSGIDYLLTNFYDSILSLLFSALFFAANVL